MNKKFLLPLAVVGSLLAGTSAQAANLVIDDFSDPGNPDSAFCTALGYAQCVHRQQVPPALPALPDDTQSSLTNVVGGSRQLSISGTNGQQSSFGIISSGGIASLANATGVASVSTLIYDGSGAGLNINENSFGGFDSFNVAVPSADLGFDITLTLTDGFGTTNFLTLFNVGLGSNNPSTVSFDLSNPAFAGLNFTDIDVVRLDLFGDADLDASLDLVGFIMSPPNPTGTPEPATMLGLLAVGAMGFASRRRQK